LPVGFSVFRGLFFGVWFSVFGGSFDKDNRLSGICGHSGLCIPLAGWGFFWPFGEFAGRLEWELQTAIAKPTRTDPGQLYLIMQEKTFRFAALLLLLAVLPPGPTFALPSGPRFDLGRGSTFALPPGLSFDLLPGLSFDLRPGLSFDLLPGLSFDLRPGASFDLGRGPSFDLPPGLSISPTTFPGGSYGSTYNTQTIKVTGGKQPYTFAVSAGSLPPGLTLSKDGVLGGTPTAVGKFSFTVAVQDHSGQGNGDRGALTSSQDYTVVIGQARLTIAANNATMTYGGAVPVPTLSYKGFVNGDNVSSLTTPASINTSVNSSSPPGNYSITPSGAVDPNYSITYTSATFTVNPASLVVTANAQTKQYGAPDPTLTYTVSGFVNGDNTSIVTGSLSRAPGENVGSYSISKGSLGVGANYTLSYTGSSLTITKASQHITWTQNLLFGCNSTTQLQLTATASSGLPVSYSASDPSVATVSGNQLTLLHPGTTVVTANQGGDANHSAAAAVADTVVYQPASLIDQHWNDVLFFDNSSGSFVQWQWYKNGGAVVGATEPYYSESPSLNGQYYVIAMNKSGQEIQSCTVTVTGGAAIPGGIKVQPNPVNAGARATVTCNYSTSALQGAVLQVVDLNGRVRQIVTAVQPSMQITMPAQSGIYILNLLLAGGQKASMNVLVGN
jgi:MBG domain-containing protein